MAKLQNPNHSQQCCLLIAQARTATSYSHHTYPWPWVGPFHHNVHPYLPMHHLPSSLLMTLGIPSFLSWIPSSTVCMAPLPPHWSLSTIMCIPIYIIRVLDPNHEQHQPLRPYRRSSFLTKYRCRCPRLQSKHMLPFLIFGISFPRSMPWAFIFISKKPPP